MFFLFWTSSKLLLFFPCLIQLVCPGAWLCDLTLERYEVREKKISKKVPLHGIFVLRFVFLRKCFPANVLRIPLVCFGTAECWSQSKIFGVVNENALVFMKMFTLLKLKNVFPIITLLWDHNRRFPSQCYHDFQDYNQTHEIVSRYLFFFTESVFLMYLGAVQRPRGLKAMGNMESDSE